MSNEYCRRLSNAANFVGDNLFYTPCCWIKPKSIPILTKNTLDMVRTVVAKQVTENSELFCKECINRETHEYAVSDRDKAKKFIPIEAEEGSIYKLELQIDTTCNAACVTCGPHFSSLWKKQIDPTVKLDDYTSHYERIQSFDNWANLKKISFLGGEPFLSTNNLNFIKKIPHPENVMLTFVTNGSIVPDIEWRTEFVKFKQVIITFSIDGLDDQFEYIRWPLSWSKVSDNINQIANNFMDFNKNLTLGVNITVNPLNLIYVHDIENYFQNFKIPFYLHRSVCFGTWGLDGTPNVLRKYIENKFGSNDRLVEMLKAQTEVSDKFNLLKNNMESLDNIRGLDHRSTFERVFKILDE